MERDVIPRSHAAWTRHQRQRAVRFDQRPRRYKDPLQPSAPRPIQDRSEAMARALRALAVIFDIFGQLESTNESTEKKLQLISPFNDI